MRLNSKIIKSTGLEDLNFKISGVVSVLGSKFVSLAVGTHSPGLSPGTVYFAIVVFRVEDE